jgi:hypothetical protein
MAGHLASPALSSLGAWHSKDEWRLKINKEKRRMPALKHMKIGPRLMLGFGLLALMMIFRTCLSLNRLERISE